MIRWLQKVFAKPEPAPPLIPVFFNGTKPNSLDLIFGNVAHYATPAFGRDFSLRHPHMPILRLTTRVSMRVTSDQKQTIHVLECRESVEWPEVRESAVRELFTGMILYDAHKRPLCAVRTAIPYTSLLQGDRVEMRPGSRICSLTEDINHTIESLGVSMQNEYGRRLVERGNRLVDDYLNGVIR